MHWSHTLGRGAALPRTAFAYESAVDELSFVVGPAVVGLLAALRPGDGPLLGMALLLLAPPCRSRRCTPTRSPLGTAGQRVRGMAPLVDVLAPPARLPAAMTVLGSGGPVGTAIGQAVTGALVDGPGLDAAWFVPTGFASAGLLVVVTAVVRGRPPACPPGRAA